MYKEISNSLVADKWHRNKNRGDNEAWVSGHGGLKF